MNKKMKEGIKKHRKFLRKLKRGLIPNKQLSEYGRGVLAVWDFLIKQDFKLE